jgi:hypothetical protein
VRKQAPEADDQHPDHEGETADDLDAEVREVRRRAAARRDRFEHERAEARERRQAEAVAAAEAWDAHVRAHREASATAARARAEALEDQRQARLARAAALVSESGFAVDRRMRQLREAEAVRKKELAERVQARADDIAARKQAGRAMGAALAENLERTDLERQRQTELARAAAVQERSADARQVARSFLIQPRDARENEAPPPWPGEQAALAWQVHEVLPPPRPPEQVRPRMRAALPIPEPPARSGDDCPPPPAPTTATPTPTPQPLTPPAPHAAKSDALAKRAASRTKQAASRSRVAVTPLDLDVLNALLQQQAE